jgi:4-carboxymuconolactone decarboxylase
MNNLANSLRRALLVGVALLGATGAQAEEKKKLDWDKGWQERPMRMPDVPKSEYTPEQQRVFNNVLERFKNYKVKELPGPFRAYIRNPLVLEGVINLVDSDIKGGALGHRLTRLVGTVVGGFWRAQFEFFAQSREAEKDGVSPEVIEAIRLGEVPKFTKADEQLVYDTVREITDTKTLSAASFQRARDMLGDQAAADLMHFTAFFTMIAITNVVFDIQVPEPFPARPLPPLPAATRPAG